jgi:hypothetical protein
MEYLITKFPFPELQLLERLFSDAIDPAVSKSTGDLILHFVSRLVKVAGSTLLVYLGEFVQRCLTAGPPGSARSVQLMISFIDQNKELLAFEGIHAFQHKPPRFSMWHSKLHVRCGTESFVIPVPTWNLTILEFEEKLATVMGLGTNDFYIRLDGFRLTVSAHTTVWDARIKNGSIIDIIVSDKCRRRVTLARSVADCSFE